MANTTISPTDNVLFQGPPDCCGSPIDWCNKVKWLITDRFIQREKGICCQSIDNIQLIRVTDVEYKGTCCCTCCGRIIVYSSDETNPLIYINGIANGKEVFRKLRDAVSKLQSSGNTMLEIKS